MTGQFSPQPRVKTISSNKSRRDNVTAVEEAEDTAAAKQMETSASYNGLMKFTEKLAAAWQSSGSMLCVGLDPDRNRYPDPLKNSTDRVYAFCKAIVDATAPHCCAFKPQIAYFAAQRAEEALERLIQYIHATYPKHVVVLDAKRGDMGATAQQYAVEAFERYGADAVTVNPYQGFDSFEPYLKYADHGVILLCRTSNPGSAQLQDLDVGGERLFERVARLAAGSWNTTGQLGLVVGATVPAELARVRALAPNLPLLVPGIGAQGGDVVASVQAGVDARGVGMLINSSRAILYASAGADFAQAAARAAQETDQAIHVAASS
jgi:orotidine-5'-phosphate decarboxylase